MTEMDFIQEMAAIVCVYESGAFDIVSCHYALHDAQDQLAYMRETGLDMEWHGTLRTVCNGAVHAHADLNRLSQQVPEIGRTQEDSGSKPE